MKSPCDDLGWVEKLGKSSVVKTGIRVTEKLDYKIEYAAKWGSATKNSTQPNPLTANGNSNALTLLKIVCGELTYTPINSFHQSVLQIIVRHNHIKSKKFT